MNAKIDVTLVSALVNGYLCRDVPLLLAPQLALSVEEISTDPPVEFIDVY
jgi:hypothetical protein